MTLKTISAVEVRVLSRLLDRAQRLAPDALEAWIAGLPEAQQALVPRLRERLSQIAAPPAAAAPPRPEPVRKPDTRHGERVGPYRLLHEIGTPGPGVMWQAELAAGPAARKTVALMLPPDPGAFERQIVSLPEHPNIARLLDAGIDPGGRAWRVMGWVDGVPLAEHARRRRLGALQRVPLALRVCEALANAHAEGVAHGDIRPANVLVDDEGRVTLLDWGMGRPLNAASAAADLRALAGVFEGLYAGSAPGADLKAALRRAVDDDPARRHGGVGDLLADLQRVAARRPVAGPHATPWHRAGLWLRRHRLGLAAGALALPLLLGAGVLGLRHYQSSQAEGVRADRARDFIRQSLPEDLSAGDPAQQLPLLQQVLERTRVGFAGEPVLRGQVLTEIGLRFRSVGQPEQALAVLREAQSLLQGTAAAADPALARVRAELAFQLLGSGEPGSAAQSRVLAEQALAACGGGTAGCAPARLQAQAVLARLASAKP